MPSELVWPLLMIGVGISLPWGLMDGLAVSVVPKERAGMATGIFSTTRVAGEGVALAVVSAVLSELTKGRILSSGGRTSEAAQRLVTGDLADARTLVPDVSPATVVQNYSDAFGTLLGLLTIITLITATVVLLFLRGTEDGDGESLKTIADSSGAA
jgi:sugar phosphate permease